MPHRNGFTLVELAIVLMIIGLLIGGILKGQEMIENARVVSGVRQVQSYDAAAITFKDMYAALPGDITNPATRLANCTAAKCITPGNGNGQIIIGDESNNYWVHLGAAGLISGIDTNAAWTGSFDFLTPVLPAMEGTRMTMYFANVPVSATWPEGRFGHGYVIRNHNAAGTLQNWAIPFKTVAAYDRKMDNELPWTGHVQIHNCSGTDITGATTYDIGSDPARMCRFWIGAGF